jgi:hypothetical protein
LNLLKNVRGLSLWKEAAWDTSRASKTHDHRSA